MDIIDKDFLKDNIDDFITLYFEFNPEHLKREKQYKQRWFNCIGQHSPSSKDKTEIGTTTILYIQTILKLQNECDDLDKNNRIERRKRHQEEIDSLNKKINEFKNYTEHNWRKITNTFRRYIIENHGEEEYEELVYEELQDLKVIPRPDNTGRNIKSYHGI
mgnify:CR=1 FL=1